MQGLMFIALYLVVNVRGQLMPGISPSNPSPVLKRCMTPVGYGNVTGVYTNRFANAVHRWCSVYEDVIPCLSDWMETTHKNLNDSPSDWFLSLVYDSQRANLTTTLMCKKLKSIADDLLCIRKNVRRALKCTKIMTDTVKAALMKMYISNETDSKSASKGACLISVSTAECFKGTMATCKKHIRRFIGAYYKILGGKCENLLDKVDNITPNPSIVNTKKAEDDWMSTIKSVLQSEVNVTLTPVMVEGDTTETDEALTLFSTQEWKPPTSMTPQKTTPTTTTTTTMSFTATTQIDHVIANNETSADDDNTKNRDKLQMTEKSDPNGSGPLFVNTKITVVLVVMVMIKCI